MSPKNSFQDGEEVYGVLEGTKHLDEHIPAGSTGSPRSSIHVELVLLQDTTPTQDRMPLRECGNAS
eukprot:1200805-Amphidinium_carterae.1